MLGQNIVGIGGAKWTSELARNESRLGWNASRRRGMRTGEVESCKPTGLRRQRHGNVPMGCAQTFSVRSAMTLYRSINSVVSHF